MKNISNFGSQFIKMEVKVIFMTRFDFDYHETICFTFGWNDGGN